MSKFENVAGNSQVVSTPLSGELQTLLNKTVHDLYKCTKGKPCDQINLSPVIDDIAQAQGKSQGKAEYENYLHALNSKTAGLIKGMKFADGTPYCGQNMSDFHIAGITSGRQKDLMLAWMPTKNPEPTVGIKTVTKANNADLSFSYSGKDRNGKSVCLPEIEITRSTDDWLAQKRPLLQGLVKESVSAALMNKDIKTGNLKIVPEVSSHILGKKDLSSLYDVWHTIKNDWNSSTLLERQRKSSASECAKMDKALKDNQYAPTTSFMFQGKLRSVTDSKHLYLGTSEWNEKRGTVTNTFYSGDLAVRGEKGNYIVVGAETGSAIVKFANERHSWQIGGQFPEPERLFGDALTSQAVKALKAQALLASAHASERIASTNLQVSGQIITPGLVALHATELPPLRAKALLYIPKTNR